MTGVSEHHELTGAHGEAVMAFLRGAGIPFELREHPSHTTALEEAHAEGQAPEQVAKTIVVLDGPRVVLAVVSASDRLDLHKLRDVLGTDRPPVLASEDRIRETFPSYEPGAVPPCGPFVPAAEVIDSALASQPQMLCAAGDHRHSVLLEPRRVVQAMAATVADICEE